MPRRPPPPPPPGSRVPGSGRRKGTPNRRIAEARQLCSDLVHDLRYQNRLRHDFLRRRVHPSIETMLWHYSLGKPQENIELRGGLTVNQCLIDEREWLREHLDHGCLDEAIGQDGPAGQRERRIEARSGVHP